MHNQDVYRAEGEGGRKVDFDLIVEMVHLQIEVVVLRIRIAMLRALFRVAGWEFPK